MNSGQEKTALAQSGSFEMANYRGATVCKMFMNLMNVSSSL